MNLSIETLENIRELLKDKKYRMPREISLAIVGKLLHSMYFPGLIEEDFGPEGITESTMLYSQGRVWKSQETLDKEKLSRRPVSSPPPKPPKE